MDHGIHPGGNSEQTLWYAISLSAFALLFGGLAVSYGYKILVFNGLKHDYANVKKLKLKIAEVKEKYDIMVKRSALISGRKNIELVECMLLILAEILPGDVRLENFSYQANEQVLMQGIAISLKAFQGFIKLLEKEPCFKHCQIKSINATKGLDRFEFSVVITPINEGLHGKNQTIASA